MPLTRTLAQLRTQAREYADMESSAFVSDAEVDRLVNLGLAQLWHLLVSVDIDRHVTSTEIATSAGTLEYGLPADFAQLRSVERLTGSGSETGYTLERYSLGEGHSHGAYPVFADGDFIRYALVGQGVDGTSTRLRFNVDPGVRYFRVWYIQHPVELTVDTDAFDGVAGWEEWAVLWAAEQMMAKEESDPSALIRRRTEMTARVRDIAAHRDAGTPPQIVKRRGRRRGRGRLYRG